jgi:hypothetical protein
VSASFVEVNHNVSTDPRPRLTTEAAMLWAVLISLVLGTCGHICGHASAGLVNASHRACSYDHLVTDAGVIRWQLFGLGCTVTPSRCREKPAKTAVAVTELSKDESFFGQ